MPRVRRLVLCIVWPFATFVGWICMFVVGARAYLFGMLTYNWPQLQNVFPEWVMKYVLLDGLFLGGSVVSTVVVLVLCLRGKMPGTRLSGETRRGFAVETMQDEPA